MPGNPSCGLLVQRLTPCPCPLTEPPADIASPMRSKRIGSGHAQRLDIRNWTCRAHRIRLRAGKGRGARSGYEAARRNEDIRVARQHAEDRAILQRQRRKGFSYQFWMFDKDHKNPFLLNRDEDED